MWSWANRCNCTHLQKHHWHNYCREVIAEQLKGWQTMDDTTSSSQTAPQEQEPFSLEGFYEQLVSWVVVDDQVCNFQV
jgi:hypothetical protein